MKIEVSKRAIDESVDFSAVDMLERQRVITGPLFESAVGCKGATAFSEDRKTVSRRTGPDQPFLDLVTMPAQDETVGREVQAFARSDVAAMTLELRARFWIDLGAQFSWPLTAGGWLGLTLLKKYGAQGDGLSVRFVMRKERLAEGAPVTIHKEKPN